MSVLATSGEECVSLGGPGNRSPLVSGLVLRGLFLFVYVLGERKYIDKNSITANGPTQELSGCARDFSHP